MTVHSEGGTRREIAVGWCASVTSIGLFIYLVVSSRGTLAIQAVPLALEILALTAFGRALRVARSQSVSETWQRAARFGVYVAVPALALIAPATIFGLAVRT
jgi:hypothetical protein